MSVVDYHIVMQVSDAEVLYSGTNLREAADALVGSSAHGTGPTAFDAWLLAIRATKALKAADERQKQRQRRRKR